ncbi:MAG: diguanylate cyclase [Xanthobacteraceae bacterium]
MGRTGVALGLVIRPRLGGLITVMSRDHDYTLRIAEMALERIKSLSLPADPPGYELWYSYVAGHNAELNRSVNRALDAGDGLSLPRLDEIYDEHLSPSRTRSGVERVGTQVSGEIDNIIGMLDELILSTSETRGNCADASSKLAESSDRNSVRAVADALVKSLRSVELRQAALEQRLGASKHELEVLQQALTMMSIEASLDTITGLANRRHFDRAIETAIEQADAAFVPVSLLMIDIDNFKVFNDQFGHVTGDSVLRLVGAALKQSIKGQDIAARYGGEEFAVILPNTDLRGAAVVAEQVRRKIAGGELKRRSDGQRLGAITVSIGVASHQRGERSRTMIERADACLYEAKRAGRNCTRCEDDQAGLRGNAA